MASATRTVLLVEDESDTRESLKTLIELKGYSVETAEDGRQALEILSRAEPPCLVLLDLLMPWMSGWEFLAEVQKIERLSSVPIVLVTAMDNTDYTDVPGTIGCLGKPIDVERLYALLEVHC